MAIEEADKFLTENDYVSAFGKIKSLLNIGNSYLATEEFWNLEEDNDLQRTLYVAA